MLRSAWPHGAEDAIGQTGEFLVWAALTSQSGGRLHVFLPLLDRGIDGLIHRLDDGAYIAVQVKAKSTVGHGEAPIAIYEDHLFTDDQLVIGVFLDGEQLGPHALVIDAATLKQTATRIDDRGRSMLIVDIPVSPNAHHKWSDHVIDVSQLAGRLGMRPSITEERLAPTPVPSDEDHVIGFVGEQEVCRRLAALDGCALFRPFPDNELVEVAVRHLATGSTVGLQVKTAQLRQPNDVRHVLIDRASFVVAESSYIVALGWIVSEGRFHETCMVIPTSDVASVASVDGRYYEFHFRPDGSRERSRLDRYRTPLDRLSEAVSRLLE